MVCIIMKFEDLEDFIRQADYKVGDMFHGAVIEEIVPVPADYVNEYIRLYKQYQKAEYALAALCTEKNINPLNLDYGAIAICDRNDIETTGVVKYFILADTE